MSGKLHLTEIGRVAVPGVDVDAEIARWGHPVPPMFRLREPGGNSLTIVEPVE